MGNFGMRTALGFVIRISEEKSLSGPDNMSRLGCKICERELQAYSQKAINDRSRKVTGREKKGSDPPLQRAESLKDHFPITSLKEFESKELLYYGWSKII
ncbi:hypothetical protein AVEN_230628-1 [Araneus ventricosus]|uniref:Uncharacterized protein n=1 Tax=Araneus ventricosus TaxID=182803 RepID=A0A4Y2A1C9_ARAVE|nr:hypothetical protein AVEN_230628-1 [Araneus ventricosus]